MTDVDISIILNEVPRKLHCAPNAVLADVLRDRFYLTGCKIACDQSTCGACTVLVGGRPTAACATFAFAVDGAAITTIEGLGTPDALHLVQRAFLAENAVQCGFCTSGMILVAVALLATHPDPDVETIRDWLASNICRCTGYGPIVAAIRRAAQDMARELA